MSMLAEPRRKQKWSVDPRNSAWSNDDSKFGQKMLERMGWSKGKGLGRSEQGCTDHIKVKVKNDSYGLGANASHEDNWIAHQDDFNELLAQLNSHHGQNNSTAPPPEEPKGFSLEEKSKSSRKRVHYTKFTKGKDLSSRTETDLNCIFGKRARSAKDQEQESNSSDSLGEAEETSTPANSKLDTEAIANTVTSTLSMQEYFAQRMAQLKKSRGQAQSTPPSVEADAAETPGPSEEPDPILSSTDDSDQHKKKKKKKKSKKGDELEVAEQNLNAPNIMEDDEDQQQECPGKKKKKKRKMTESDGATNDNCSSASGVERNCEELPPSSKKKKKQQQQQLEHSEESELVNGHEDQTVESELVIKKKKKKKHREEVDDVVKEDKEEPLAEKPKKDKKKKKKHQE